MASRQTRVIGGNGLQTQSFELAPGILQYVQSVLVEIDTSGSGDTTPLLTVRTSDGTPVADKPQGRSLDGGGSGRATWALRLDDERETYLPIERFASGNPSVAVNALKFLDFGKFFGANLVDLTVPTSPVIIAAGEYALCGWVHAFPSPAAATTGYFDMIASMNGPGDGTNIVRKDALETVLWPGAATNAYRSFSLVWRVPAGATLAVTVTNHLNAARFFEMTATLQKLS